MHKPEVENCYERCEQVDRNEKFVTRSWNESVASTYSIVT